MSRKFMVVIRSRQIFVVAAFLLASVLLTGCGKTAHETLIYEGQLSLYKENPSTEKNTAYTFVFDDSIKIPMYELTGKICECSDIIKKQCEKYDMISSQSPYITQVTFQDKDDAVKYIGYGLLKMPEISVSPEESIIHVEGDPKGNLSKVVLEEVYKIPDDITAYSMAYIFTDSFQGEISIGATSYSDGFSGVDYSERIEIMNDREFHIMNSTEFKDGWLTQSIYWQENNVLYELDLRYKEEEKEKIEEIANCWMKSF